MNTTIRAGLLAAALASAACGVASAAPAPKANGPLTWVGVLRSDDAQAPSSWRRFTVGPDGRPLRSEPVHAQVTGLVASPDGRRIAYQYGRQIYIARRDGSHPHRVAAHGTDPSWAPDGERLVYAQVAMDLPSRRIDGGLMVRRVRGGGSQRLTRGSDRFPAWSPDGTAIAFVRERSERGCDGASALHAIPPEGGRTTRLLSPGYTCGGVGRPAFSPRGDRLVFELNRSLSEVLGPGDEDRDHSTDARAAAQVGINVAHADGTHRRRLTPNGQWPVWSPDGRQIAFHAHLRTCAGAAAGGDAVCAVTPGGAARTVVAMPRDFDIAHGLTWFPHARR